jgi:SAM-dependent methyltransferase
MKDNDKIRTNVAESYARAVKSGGGCCGGDTLPKGELAKLADYTREELDSLPHEAVVSSFGCGNPLAFADTREGDVVLDLGCGAGIDILLAAKQVGPRGHVIGVDMTDEMIEQARKNIAASGLQNVEVRKGLIEDLPVESASVDWVISNCVINLSPEKDKVFAEIARVLKPGGKMRVSDIVVKDLPQWARQDQTLYNSCIGGVISEEAYTEGLRRAGLKEPEVVDRLVYDKAQLAGLIGSELPPAEDPTHTPVSCCGPGEPVSASEQANSATSSCCGPGLESPAHPEKILALAEALASKIWSASFVATK